MRKYDITVIGEANVDLILRGEDLVPGFGQAEKLVEDATLDLGGSSAIFACGAGRLDLKVSFIGKLGADEFGTFLIKVLESRGVDTSNIITDHQKKTGVTLHLSRLKDRAMLTYPGTIDTMECHEIDERIFHQTRHVHVSSFFLQKGLQKGLAYLFERAKAAGATVSVDPGWDPEERWNGYLQPVLDQIDIFLPNDQEAMHITSTQSIADAIKELRSRLPLSVIKMGQKGACALQSGEVKTCHGFKVSSVDATGAGDSFNAGFLYAYLHDYELNECLRWGCACGALSTRSAGGIAAQPTITEVTSFLAQYLED
jgi:sugar/nucleoside kinase (ribokinase family)